MNAATIGWKRLTPHVIDELPEQAAVFEVANLVRTVQFIGSAQGNLRSRLTAFAQPRTELPAVPGGYYFRYETAAQEDETLASRLASYRETHFGKLPSRNMGPTRTARVAPLRAA